MLTLTLTCKIGAAGSSAATRTLTAGRLRIGRGSDNDWVLTDPGPVPKLSRQHCVIEGAGRQFVVIDTSTNGVWLNGAETPIGRGNAHSLRDGDHLDFGEYVLGVRLDSALDPVPAPVEPDDAWQSAATTDRPEPTAVTGSADAARLYAAFLEGAGLETGSITETDPQALMRRAGELLRHGVQGLYRALLARADAKADLFLDGTVLRPADNNPIKFAESEADALACVLNRVRPGFLPGPQAVAAGFEDLEAHSHALKEGLRVALSSLVQEFAPDRLTARLATISMIEKALPVLLRARTWDLYEETFARIANDVQAGFDTEYWKAYGRAYEEYTRRER